MDFKDPKLEFLADMSFGLDMYDVAEINNGYKCAGYCLYIMYIRAQVLFTLFVFVYV
jgi:hypothetical protein